MSTQKYEYVQRKDDASKMGQPIPFPTCTWDGSVQPEQFIKFCEQGLVMEVADWKYGWPHKVYIDVPNPKPDEDRLCGSTSVGSKLQYHPDGRHYYVKTQETGPADFPIWSDSSGWSQAGKYPMLHLKFYTEHLKELPDLAQHKELIAKAIGIEFWLDEQQRLMYKRIR